VHNPHYRTLTTGPAAEPRPEIVPLTDEELELVEMSPGGDRDDDERIGRLVAEVRRHRDIAAALVSDEPDSKYDAGIVKIRARIVATVKRNVAALAEGPRDVTARTESPLVAHARRELRVAGFLDPQGACYGDMVGRAVLELVEAFARQGHSGGSVGPTLGLFDKVARFRPLTPLTNDPSEWADVSEALGRPCWQNRRDSSVFSEDGGRTWYDLDAPRPSFWHRILAWGRP
jgi:hypothetical protein